MLQEDILFQRCIETIAHNCLIIMCIDFTTYEVKLVYLVKYDVCIEFFATNMQHAACFCNSYVYDVILHTTSFTYERRIIGFHFFYYFSMRQLLVDIYT